MSGRDDRRGTRAGRPAGLVLASLAVAALGALGAVGAPRALAQPAPASPAPASSAPASPVKDAGKHFRRGVALYNEADYRGALVEFRRAYETAPNATVLYNIGQTQYQLQNYAAALTMFERYLTESSSASPHRREVEQTLDTLRSRVGNLRITTNVAGCEITIDDDLIGKTPFAAPPVVSVGRRKITAMHPGRTPDTRFVEIAAGETAEVSLSLLEPGRGLAGGPPAGATRGTDWVTTGWITTGALAAGAVTTGILAFVASRQLRDARRSFPTSRDDLDRKASRATTLAVATDVLAAATVVAGAVTLKLTLSRSPSHEVHVAVVPGGIELAGVFH